MDMRVKDLKSIINFCGVDEKQRVIVEVKYAGGTKERCYIKSFDQYSDCLTLVVESDVEPKDKD